MLRRRFTGLIFGFLFVLHALKSCSLHAHQGGETVGSRLVASKETFVSVQKEFLGFARRKMGGHEVVGGRKEIGGKQGLEVGDSKSSGANRSEGNRDFEGKGAFNVKCKSWNETSRTPKVETADFVAFGADYHGPKRHPPKHN